MKDFLEKSVSEEQKTITLENLIDALINEDEEEVIIPFKILYQFNKYFSIDKNNVISAKLVEIDIGNEKLEIPFIAIGALSDGWHLNISKENVCEEDVKKVVTEVINAHIHSPLTDEEYNHQKQEWIEAVKANQ